MIAQNNEKYKTDETAKKSADNTENNPRYQRWANAMSGIILTIFGIICAALFAISLSYWHKGGLENIRTGFYWLIPASVTFVLVILSTYWHFAVKPARDAKQSPEPPPQSEADIIPSAIKLIKLEPQTNIAIEVEFHNRGDEGAHIQGISKVFTTKEDSFSDEVKDAVVVEPFEIPARTRRKMIFISAEKPNKRNITAIQKDKLSVLLWGKLVYGSNGKTLKLCSAYIAKLDGFYECRKTPISTPSVSQTDKTLQDIKNLLETKKDRPEISIDLTKIFPAMIPPRVAIQFRNAGTLAAHNVRVEHWMYYRPAIEADEQIPSPPDKTDLQDTMPVMRSGAIHSPSLILENFPLERWASIRGGLVQLFVLLKLRYTDESGNFYGLDRCWRYDPTLSHLMIANNRIWPKGFDPNT